MIVARQIKHSNFICLSQNHHDPIFMLRPQIDLRATPWQMVEVRLKADHEGTGEIFWTGAAQTRYGGFSTDIPS